nr:serine/threonine-protein phosphatase [Streptomyces sp. CT34]
MQRHHPPGQPGSTAALCTDGLVERSGGNIDEGMAVPERALADTQALPTSPATGSYGPGIDADHGDDVTVMVLQPPTRTGADAEPFHDAAPRASGCAAPTAD